MLKKLRIKFVCVIMAIVVAMLCVIFGLFFHFTRQSLEDESIQMMKTIAADPFQLSPIGGWNTEVSLPYFALEINQWGSIIATGGGYFDLSDEQFLLEVAQAALTSEAQTGELEEYGLRFCKVFSYNSQCIVFVDTSSEQATLKNLAVSAVGIGALSIVVFFGISLLLAVWVVKPVELAWAQQKQFVADASHELKTPLTVILTNAELLQNPGYGEEERSQFSDNILTMSYQMRGLVESLLQQARVDNGAVNMHMAPVELSVLVEEAMLPFEPLYFEKGMALQSQVEQGIHVKGSESHLRQVVEILLDNAMKYADPQGTVTVQLVRRGGHCLLSVADPGQPITQQDLKNIFKRFYRVDEARSAGGSFGLGLSIAEGIVTAHHGKIWAESREGINTFFVQLPLSS